MPHAIDLIVTHLNAPYGAVVTRADVQALLTHGVVNLKPNDAASAAMGWLFVECSEALIDRACEEAHVPKQSANTLYAKLRSMGAPSVAAWDARLTA